MARRCCHQLEVPVIRRSSFVVYSVMCTGDDREVKLNGCAFNMGVTLKGFCFCVAWLCYLREETSAFCPSAPHMWREKRPWCVRVKTALACHFLSCCGGSCWAHDTVEFLPGAAQDVWLRYELTHELHHTCVLEKTFNLCRTNPWGSYHRFLCVWLCACMCQS